VLVKTAAGELGTIRGVSQETGEVILDTRAATGLQQPGVKSLAIGKFFEHWHLADASALREVHEAWPSKRFCQAQAAAPLMAKALIISGLAHLGDWLDKQVKPAGRITVLEKPRRMVEALQDLPAHSLVLCPETTVVRHLTAKEHAEALQPAVEATLDPPMKDTHFHLQPSMASEALAAFWRVQYTSDDRKANMVWAHFLVTQYYGQDFVGRFALQLDTPESGGPNPEQPHLRTTATDLRRGPGAMAAKTSTETDQEDPEEEDLGPMREVCVTVPVLVNTSAIKAGQELLVFRSAPPKREKEGNPILVTNLAARAKKARTA
jgi:hypothetical protein